MPSISKGTQTSLSEINMVPFVDVVLVLLIIFMITAPILHSGLDVDVPQTKTVRAHVHELGSKVRARIKNSQDPVFVRCDQTVPFGLFATVVDTLRQSGITNISIVTEPLNGRSQ